MKTKIAIYGAGGLGREVLSLIKSLPQWEVTGFYDDGKVKGTAIGNTRILGTITDLLAINEATQLVLAIGNPKIKKQLAEKLAANPHIHFPTLIHPNAWIQDPTSAKIGSGSIITAGAIMTNDITIGDHVLINLNCTVGHDVQIGDYSSIMPGANLAGEVHIGKAALIGSGANVLNGMQVGDFSRVGAGAVVTKQVHSNSTVIGVPARPINDKA